MVPWILSQYIQFTRYSSVFEEKGNKTIFRIYLVLIVTNSKEVKDQSVKLLRTRATNSSDSPMTNNEIEIMRKGG